MRPQHVFLFGFLLVATLAWPLHAFASQLTLTWTDASDNEAGFKVERSTNNSTYTVVATAPTVAGETNTANNTAQTTSTVNSVSAGPPTITGINPTSMAAGTSTSSFSITGTNFVSGATVTFSNGTGPAPTASAVLVNSAGTGITATVTVPTGGAPRNRVWDMKVTNPNGQSATKAQSFTVTP